MEYFIIYKEDYPWDVRVEKIAISLAEKGNRVTIVSRNLQQRCVIDHQGSVSIKRLPEFRYFPKLLVKLFNSPLWFNPFWLYAIGMALRGSSRPTLIVRDLPLVFSGFIFKKLKGATLVLDMAECYPEMYESSMLFGSPSIFERILKNPAVASLYEDFALKMCDHVLVMIEESRDRLICKGVSTRKISKVSNTPPIYSNWKKYIKHSGHELRIVYVGFITELRGLDILVRATKKFLDQMEDRNAIQVDIIGIGSFKEQLICLVENLGLEANVNVHGWLDAKDMEEIIMNANVGALTYRVCSHWNNTIPNKLFDYMLAGLPVLATEVIPISRIINEEKCGLVCKDQDIEDIANKMIKLRSPELREYLGNNGMLAVEKKYNWRCDENRLRVALSTL